MLVVWQADPNFNNKQALKDPRSYDGYTAIVGERQGIIMNLVDRHARPAQEAMLQIVRERPDATLNEARKLVVPRHHDVRAENVELKRLGAVLAVAYEREFRDFRVPSHVIH